jgi:uncharacterized protein (DUF488 family)
LSRAEVKRVIDTRLNNLSQLAGFAKRDDLKFLLNAVAGIQYEEMPILAPTQDMLDAYKKERGFWADYESKFLSLMIERRIELTLARDKFDGACLLCSEDKPTHCHRRLVAEYLQRHWGDVTIEHL